MKLRRSCMLLFALSPSFLNAQVIYQSSDFATANDSFLVSIDAGIALSAYNFDTTGVGFIWNFDGLNPTSQKFSRHLDPDSTGYKSPYLWGIPFIYPGCIENCINDGGGFLACQTACNEKWDSLTNAVLSLDTIDLQTFKMYDIYSLYANTGNTYEARTLGYKVDIAGISGPLTTDLNNPDIIYEFPVNYLDQNQSESSFDIDFGLGFVYTHWQNRMTEVDGWGSLTTPYGTFNTIRVKSLVHYTDKFYFDNGDSLDLTAILPDTLIEYKWLDPAYGVPILEVKSYVYEGIEIFASAKYPDSLRCLTPNALFGYLPIPTYLNSNTDSVSVNFYNLSINGDSVHWDFGDPASGVANNSNNTSPLHYYTSEGLYNVELIVCNRVEQCPGSQCDTFNLPVIVIDTGSVYANFTSTPLFACEGDTIQFNNISVNDTAWFWNFGDGNIDSTENPAHDYLIAGEYTVTLIASNPGDIDTIQKIVTISAIPGISYLYSDSVTNNYIQFNNTTSGTDSTTFYLWTFSGASPSSILSFDESPSILFGKSDSVNVCLFAMNSLGCSATECQKIFISECLTAKFTTGISTSFCINEAFNLTDQTTSGIAETVNYQWLVEGQPYSSSQDTTIEFSVAGTYEISLIASNSRCSDTISKYVFIKDYAGITTAGDDVTICVGDTIQLAPEYSTGGQTSILSWSPGTDLSATLIPNPYAYPGATTSYIFNVLVLAGSCDGLFHSISDTMTIFVDTAVQVNAGFIYSDVNGTVTFTDTSIGAASWIWYFDDGDSSELQNPIHNYMAEGTYNVTLIGSNNCGNIDTVTQSVVVVFTDILADRLPVNLRVFPNPFSKELNVEFHNVADKELRFDLTDVLGKIIATWSFRSVVGQDTYKLDIPDNLENGVFTLKCAIGDYLTYRSLVYFRK